MQFLFQIHEISTERGSRTREAKKVKGITALGRLLRSFANSTGD